LLDAQAAIVEGQKQVLRHVAAQQFVDASAAEDGTECDIAHGVRGRVVLQRVEKGNEWSQRSDRFPAGDKRHVAQHCHRPRLDHAEELWRGSELELEMGLGV